MIIYNYLFLLASAMALFFSIGHAVWGLRFILVDVQASTMPALTKHMLLVIWHQPTVFHFLAAVALFIAALSGDKLAAYPLAIFIGVVTFGFFLNYGVTSLVKNRSALPQIIPQTIAIAVYFGIIIAGMWG
jgi:hypothetical protein